MTLPAPQKPRKRGIDDVITEDGAEAFPFPDILNSCP